MVGEMENSPGYVHLTESTGVVVLSPHWGEMNILLLLEAETG